MAERGVENLRIWQDARIFVNDIYNMMSSCRDYGFRDQIQRASVSIMNNIAEGFESGTDARFIYFLNVAKGSCSEVKSMLYLCEDFQVCTSKERELLTSKLLSLSGGIYNLIQYLRKQPE
ncbi:MAG: four helix bundle protein [Bacteroidaceae bacterium]|nr:four helix bundle protein [Bacteroidaceae bacterium]